MPAVLPIMPEQPKHGTVLVHQTAVLLLPQLQKNWHSFPTAQMLPSRKSMLTL